MRSVARESLTYGPAPSDPWLTRDMAHHRVRPGTAPPCMWICRLLLLYRVQNVDTSLLSSPLRPAPCACLPYRIALSLSLSEPRVCSLPPLRLLRYTRVSSIVVVVAFLLPLTKMEGRSPTPLPRLARGSHCTWRARERLHLIAVCKCNCMSRIVTRFYFADICVYVINKAVYV